MALATTCGGFYCFYKNMVDISDKFNINLNQNLWVLIIGYLGIGVSEFYCLRMLFLFSTILSVATTISMICCLDAYTKEYRNKKLKKIGAENKK